MNTFASSPGETDDETASRWDEVVSRAESASKASAEYMAQVHRKLTLTRLSSFRRPPDPIRDPSIDLPDDEVITRLGQIRRSNRVNKTDRAWGAEWGCFQKLVFEHELVAVGNLKVLLGAAAAFHQAGDKDGLADILEFIRREYRWKVRRVPLTHLEICRAAEQHARRRDLLSDEVLYGRRLPAWHAARSEPTQMEL